MLDALMIVYGIVAFIILSVEFFIYMNETEADRLNGGITRTFIMFGIAIPPLGPIFLIVKMFRELKYKHKRKSVETEHQDTIINMWLDKELIEKEIHKSPCYTTGVKISDELSTIIENNLHKLQRYRTFPTKPIEHVVLGMVKDILPNMIDSAIKNEGAKK